MTSPKPTRRSRGFTLIELMITVGLIGVLAAIAIPNFLTYQARSRRTEAYANLAALATAQKAYQAETNVFLDIGETGEPSLPDPAVSTGDLGTQKLPWDAPSQAFFSKLGWTPEGDVFYTYEVSTPAFGATCTCDLCFTAAAHGDVDGDGGWSAVMYVRPQVVAGVLGSCKTYINNFAPPVRPGGSDPVYDEVALQLSLDDY